MGTDPFTAAAESDSHALSQGKKGNGYGEPSAFPWEAWEQVVREPRALCLAHLLGGVPGFLSHSNPSLLPAVLAFQSLVLALVPFLVNPRRESSYSGSDQWIEDFSASHVIH